MPDYLDRLKETYFSDCDPAFFPDDEIDRDAYREELEALENDIDNAETWATTINDEKKSKRTEEIRHLIAKAHLLVLDEMEES